MVSHPSRVTTHWAQHGRYLEFPSYTTNPQQDVSARKQATKIHPVTDKRAQPHNGFVKANVHHHRIKSLPPKTATKQEVREFLFFVLGCDRFSSVADKETLAVITTIAWCRFDGSGLRKVRDEGDWLRIVPLNWLTVYGAPYCNTGAQRTAVAHHLYKAIDPLLRVEEKAEHKTLGEAFKKRQIQAQKERGKKQKEHEKECRKEKAKFNMEALRENLREIFCFGKGGKRSETPPPAYVENIGM